MNRLNQTEPATFSILSCWTFFMDSVFLYFILFYYQALIIVKQAVPTTALDD
jgi:hypothetical protein